MNPLFKYIGLSLILGFSWGSAQQASFKELDAISQYLANSLEKYHFSKKSIEQISPRAFDAYIESLDPAKIYFFQGDIDLFKDKYSHKIPELIKKQELSTAILEIHNTYEKRVKAVSEYIDNLLESDNFDFTKDETLEIKDEDKWHADQLESQAYLRKLIKSNYLDEYLVRENLKKTNEKAYNELTSSIKDLLQKRYKRIQLTLEKETNETKINGFLKALAIAFDPHTSYFDINEWKRFESSMANSLVGIGALLSSDDSGYSKVSGIVVGSPADQQGELALGDKIMAVDSKANGNPVDITFMRLDAIVDLIRGKKGSKVRLKIKSTHDSATTVKWIEITRDRIEIKNEFVKAEIIQTKDDKKLAVISIPSFYYDFNDPKLRVSTHLKQVLERLRDEKVQGILLDLRNNGGGYLEEVRKMVGYFTGYNPMLQIKDSRGGMQVLSTPFSKAIYQGPLAVLTNKFSASASEILAAALQDYGRAVIIGDDSTYGKGTVQEVKSLASDMPFFSPKAKAGFMKVTIQKYYRVNGSSVQNKGVVSDIVLPSRFILDEYGEATQDYSLPHDIIPPVDGISSKLQKLSAVDYLSQQSEQRIQASEDFKEYELLRQEMLEREEKTTISLNLAQRQQEQAELIAKGEKRKELRKQRYAQQSETDLALFDIYSLSIEDIKTPNLPLANQALKDDYMKLQKTKDQDDSEPELPHGWVPEKREALNILMDLVDYNQQKLALAQ